MAENKSLFKTNISPCCEYCLNSKRIQGGMALYCSNNRENVTRFHSCEHFSYDPLKRIPKRAPLLPTFPDDAFVL